MTIKVLVVDDSPLIRQVLCRTLGADGDIEVVGAAENAMAAREAIKRLNPHVLTLDIEMPDMNGLDFLDRVMRLRPMPVVMVSTLTTRGASETLLALELGAVDFVAKPDATLSGGLERFCAALRDKVRAAALADVRARVVPTPPRSERAGPMPAGAVIALGASTGGVEAIRCVLSGLGPHMPPVVIAQHMPEGFTARFAARLNELAPMTVLEAQDRQPLESGHAYVARGDRHLRVERQSGRLVARLSQDAPISGHRPSVDALFASVAQTCGPRAIGVIMTGMGRDGAQGLKAMHAAGSHTIGQSPASCLVYGMPRAAFEAGALSEQVPLEKIAGRLAEVLARLPQAA